MSFYEGSKWQEDVKRLIGNKAVGMCPQHPGQSLFDCPMCSLESFSQKFNSIDFTADDARRMGMKVKEDQLVKVIEQIKIRAINETSLFVDKLDPWVELELEKRGFVIAKFDAPGKDTTYEILWK